MKWITKNLGDSHCIHGVMVGFGGLECPQCNASPADVRERRARIRALVLALLHDGRTYEPFAYADVVALAIQYDNKIEEIR